MKNKKNIYPPSQKTAVFRLRMLGLRSLDEVGNAREDFSEAFGAGECNESSEGFRFKTPSFRMGEIHSRISILFVLLFSILCSLFSAAYAAKIHPSAGTTSAAFLKISAGARAVSMAGAFAGVCGDPYAVYWNPAGLACLKKSANIGFSHNEHFQGMKREFLVYTVDGEYFDFIKGKALSRGVWGFGLNYFYTPEDMERRSGLNESDPLNPISPVEGEFGAYDAALSASYGFEYGNGWKLGATLKFIRQVIDNESGRSAALDLGALKPVKLFGEDFMSGFAVQNIGPGIKFISERYDLPLVFRAGLSRRIERSLIAFGVEKSIDNYPFLKLGIEQRLSEKLFLRGGYKYRIHGNELGAASGLAAGFGFGMGGFNFDYAFAPYGDLGNSHRFSLSFHFGEIREKKAFDRGVVVMAENKIIPLRRFLYEVTARPVKISAGGILYEVSAKNPLSGVREIFYGAQIRGSADFSLEIAEGKLPAKLAPPGRISVLKSFQVMSGMPNIQGNLRLKFKSEAGKKTVFLYLAPGGWKKAEIRPADSAGESGFYETSVPFSTHFVIGVK